ncbi:MAG: flagellar export chaperone FliS [Chitinivibrionales bacterium]|nr:flagellar export chaperone FliS [Chitinivibrionales bacterium]
MKSAYSVYKTADVQTADQGRLIIIAYDVAIKHCRLAVQVFNDKKKIEERNKHLYKVQDAISELMGSLRMDVGEIATNLYRLYEYMLWRLVQSIAKSSPQFVEEIAAYLTDLREAWNEAIRIHRADKERSDDSTDQSSSVRFSG